MACTTPNLRIVCTVVLLPALALACAGGREDNAVAQSPAPEEPAIAAPSEEESRPASALESEDDDARVERSDDFMLTLTVDASGETVYRSVAYFQGPMAFGASDDGSRIDVIYDLQRLNWRDLSTGRMMSLEECDRKLEEGKRRIRAELESMPDGFKKRMISHLNDPQLDVQESDEGLVFSSEFGTFEVETVSPPNDDRLGLFRAYDRLSSGWALVMKRRPPDLALLYVTSRLVQSGRLPSKIEHVPAEATGIGPVTIEYVYEPLDEETGAKLRELSRSI